MATRRGPRRCDWLGDWIPRFGETLEQAEISAIAAKRPILFAQFAKTVGNPEIKNFETIDHSAPGSGVTGICSAELNRGNISKAAATAVSSIISFGPK